jgi:hypothetical protein
MITLTLRDTAIKISGEINKALVKHINMAIAKNRGKVSKRFKNEVKGWLRQSPEINSLLAQGSPESLNAVFGLAPGAGNSAVDAIINSVVDSMQIKISKISPRYRGEILFNFQENSLGNILGLSEGHQITLFGEDLHWLNWLLTSGDAIVIKGFSYEPSKDGRSGGGTMKVGGSFRVPPEYAGVLGNNFITRAFEGKDKEIFNILTQLLV